MILLCFVFSIGAQTSNLRKPVTLNCMDEPISSVLNTLSRLSGTNIVLATDQTGMGEKEQKELLLISGKSPLKQLYPL